MKKHAHVGVYGKILTWICFFEKNPPFSIFEGIPDMKSLDCRRIAAFLGVCLTLFIGSISSARAQEVIPAEQDERWYRVEISGAPAGWMLERGSHGEERNVAETRLRLEIRRGGADLTLDVASRWTESADGSPLELWSRQELGAMPIETTYRYTDEEIVVRVEQNGEIRETRRPRAPRETEDDSWTMPYETRDALRGHLESGDESFTTVSVDPLFGLEPIVTTWTLEARDVPVEIGGTTYSTSRWRQTQSLAPEVVTVVELDGRGRMVASRTRLMGLEMVVTLADEASARGALEGQREVGLSEVLVRTFVRPNRVIERPRETRRAVYRVRSEMDGAPPLPSLGAQRVELVDGAARVTVDLTVDLEESRETEEIDAARYLAPTTWLDHEDPRVRELLIEAALGEEMSAAERAEILRRFVHAYLTETGLGTALATAGEVAVTRAGDCTENSVLLSALLRAAEIPSRVVTGLIYVDRFAGARQIFGYHMWSQAWLDGRWVDLDSTTPNPFDAAHLALGTSALDEDTGWSDLGRIAGTLGGLEIEVVEVDGDVRSTD